MILQPASRKEVKRVTVGTLVCDVLMVAGLFLASQFDIGTFDLGKILLSAAIGSCVAVLKEVKRPSTPKTATIQIPRANFCWSQKATIRKKQTGNRTEKPNCVTQTSNERYFMVAPKVQIFASCILTQKIRINKLYFCGIIHFIF